MDASSRIYMYFNIEMNIMKNQSGSHGFRIQAKIFVFIYFMFYALAIVYIYIYIY